MVDSTADPAWLPLQQLREGHPDKNIKVRTPRSGNLALAAVCLQPCQAVNSSSCVLVLGAPVCLFCTCPCDVVWQTHTHMCNKHHEHQLRALRMFAVEWTNHLSGTTPVCATSVAYRLFVYEFPPLSVHTVP